MAANAASMASAVTAAAAAGAKAAASSGTGMNAGVEIKGKKEQHSSSQQSSMSVGSNWSGNSGVSIETETEGASVNITGSTITTSETGFIFVKTDNLNVEAGQSYSSSRKDKSTQTIEASYSIGSGFGGLPTVGGTKETETTNTLTHTLSNIQGGKISIDIANDATFKGASIHAEEALHVKVGGNMTVESVQNSHTSSSSSQTVNTSGNINITKDSETSLETVRTTLTGNAVKIEAKGKLEIVGATVAAGSYGKDGTFTQTNNLDVSAGSLEVKDLVDSTTENSMNIGGGYSEGTASLNSGGGMETSRDKQLATLGGGRVVKEDTRLEDIEDFSTLNRDIANQTKNIYAIEQDSASIDMQLDTRMLSTEGWKDIKKDFHKMSLLGRSVSNIATTEAVGVFDFFEEVDRQNRYDTVKEEMMKNPEMLNTLTSTDAVAKQALLNKLSNSLGDVSE
jgi:filamentous hemagglutinin